MNKRIQSSKVTINENSVTKSTLTDIPRKGGRLAFTYLKLFIGEKLNVSDTLYCLEHRQCSKSVQIEASHCSLTKKNFIFWGQIYRKIVNQKLKFQVYSKSIQIRKVSHSSFTRFLCTKTQILHVLNNNCLTICVQNVAVQILRETETGNGKKRIRTCAQKLSCYICM